MTFVYCDTNIDRCNKDFSLPVLVNPILRYLASSKVHRNCVAQLLFCVCVLLLKTED